MSLESFFDGIGTELVSLAIGLIAGGCGGYKLGSKVKQKQKARDNAKQNQVGSVNIYNGK